MRLTMRSTPVMGGGDTDVVDNAQPPDPSGFVARYDRAQLLGGPKRNQVLSLAEVRRYGVDSFTNADYLRLYGMSPAQWYAAGVRLLGRTAVECTRDELADAIGGDVAHFAAALGPGTRFTVIDPFAGSCNTLYWILRRVPDATGLACELDPQVYALSARNVAGLDQGIELIAGDYRTLLDGCHIPPDHAVIAFLAPPWGAAFDERSGLDLRYSTPPVTDILRAFGRRFADRRMLYAIQVHQKLNPQCLAELQEMLDWSQLRIYDHATTGGNHGVLLATTGWTPDS